MRRTRDCFGNLLPNTLCITDLNDDGIRLLRDNCCNSKGEKYTGRAKDVYIEGFLANCSEQLVRKGSRWKISTA